MKFGPLRFGKVLSAVLVLAFSFGLASCGGGSSNSIGNPGSHANAISIVQSTGFLAGCKQISGCDSQSVSLPNSVTNGDLIAVVLSWNESNVSGSAVISVTDSANNIYTSIGPTTNFSCGDDTLCYGFYARNVAGANNLTVQASLANSNGFGFNMAVLEVKGATTFDFWKPGGCSIQAGCTAYSTDQFELTHSDELLVGVASLGGQVANPPFSIGAGPDFTEVYTNGNFAVEYLVASTTGQYQGVFMSNTAGFGSVIFAAFY